MDANRRLETPHVLLAGDSNVHRLCSNISSEIMCLPVSGAKFVRDQKQFRDVLKAELKRNQYDRLYLHLRSNDVLVAENVFYESVMDLYDLVQSVSPGTDVIFCEVLPRRASHHSRWTTEEMARSMNRWVRKVNGIVQELTDFVPLFHYLPYGKGFQTQLHLADDGLHLNRKGAEFCSSVIEVDSLKEPFPLPAADTPLFDPVFDDPAEWPALVEPVPETYQSSTTTYSEMISKPTNPGVIVVVKSDAGSAKSTKSRQSCQPKLCVREWAFRVGRKCRRPRWIAKPKKEKQRERYVLQRERNTKDVVELEVGNGFAIAIQAYKLAGICLKSLEKKPAEEPRVPQKDFSSPAIERKKAKKEIPTFRCPDCEIVCSREDFLLDHVFIRHVKDVPVSCSTKKQRKKIRDFISDEKTRCEGCQPSKSYSKPYTDNQQPSCEGEYYIFSPTQWLTIIQIMMLDFLCGHEGMFHVILSLAFPQNVDISQLLLMLANDVERQPGPVYTCKWDDCKQKFNSVGALDEHLVRHATVTKTMCCWDGCAYLLPENLQRLTIHILQHLYNDPDIFSTIEDWYAVQASGNFNFETTNLQLCPRHLRSELKMLLFDEDFKIKSDTYTGNNHLQYLESISISNPEAFKKIEVEFVIKRTMLGENWDEYIGKSDGELSFKSNTGIQKSCSSLIYQYKPYYTVKNKMQCQVVTTERPELASGMSTSVKLTQSRKRKLVHEEILHENFENTNDCWSENLKRNLSTCTQAMNIQKQIMQKILESGMLTPQNQHIFKLEKEALKLASLENCCSGSFLCTVIKCSIDDEIIFYVRYVESGIYLGFMMQKYLNVLQTTFGFTNNVLLHNSLTDEDISVESNKTKSVEIKRSRPDKIFKHSTEKILPAIMNDLKTASTTDFGDLNLLSFISHFVPFKGKSSIDNGEKSFLNIREEERSSEIQSLLLDYRLNKLPFFTVTSKDIYSERLSAKKNLLQQSVVLNCLSGNINHNQCLFKKTARFESNFVHIENKSLATSLRNRTISLFLAKNFFALTSFYEQYFPQLNANPASNNENFHLEPVLKKQCKSSVAKPLRVTRNELEKTLPLNEKLHVPLSQGKLTIYEQFCCSLLEHGKLVIQSTNDHNIVSCMNDYSDLDGSFKENEFVFTIKLRQETGDYFYCSCSIYRTLLNIQNCDLMEKEFVVLDGSGDNCVTCMHCKFMKENVIPNLVLDACAPNTKMRLFVQNALQYQGKEFVELSRFKDTRKFSIFIEEDDNPSFVHLTRNRNIDKYIVSCMNGSCRAIRGYKKTVNNLLTADVCKHLSILKKHSECWQDLFEGKELESCDNGEHGNYFEEQINSDIISDEPNISPNVEETHSDNFNALTGIWQFKCKSQHAPEKRDSNKLRKNILKRDRLNDEHLIRLSDGCLKGPTLCPEIPENTCDCGSGWLKRNDDNDYNENGLTVTDKSRMLTIYTHNAPVKCDVHVRLCYNKEKPCMLKWDEGQSDSVHVLSRDTAAGDEIGWEFVSMVINSGCTFSSYCNYKTENYKMRDPRAKFMDHAVFLKWWFSWAANLKTEFRKPCDICGFEPKRLCCDGTRVGVGFRNANFEEINKFKDNSPILPTLHRRMDRCFLKNMNGIDIQSMIKNRSTLDYLARREIGILKNEELLTNDELENRIELLKLVLPDEVIQSFDRFFTMQPDEKLAFAYVLKMLATTASVTSLLPPSYCTKLQEFINSPDIDNFQFNISMNEMRCYAPEIRDLIGASMLCNHDQLPNDIRLLLQYLVNESLSLQVTDEEPALPQPGSYNPEKFGRAYYFNEKGEQLRNVRKFDIDNDIRARKNIDHDDATLDFEKCQKMYSKMEMSARGTSNLFLWFCADHGHCYGFHMTGAEGRKDPAASLYSYLEKPPNDIFYDFACNLQEYCLNRESGYYKSVRFFHDIFHGYSHKCSCAFKSSRLQGFESVNSEICEQFNSFIQCIKRSARQMSQSHFCFYLQFFLHEWNERKRLSYQKKIRVALAGLM